MGKYGNVANYLPKGKEITPEDLADAIVKAREEAISKALDKMAENYKEGMRELRRTTPDLMKARLATWFRLFFSRNVGAQYMDVMNEVRKEYKRVRPKSAGIGAL